MNWTGLTCHIRLGPIGSGDGDRGENNREIHVAHVEGIRISGIRDLDLAGGARRARDGPQIRSIVLSVGSDCPSGIATIARILQPDRAKPA